jgi:hypothetical protein
LQPHCARLAELYRFPLPEELLRGLVDFNEHLFADVGLQDTLFEKTLLLRQRMPEVLMRCDDETKGFLVGWILRWGGVSANAIDEVVRLGNAAITNAEDATVTRIASWSKFVAFRDPQNHAILDSRVVYSLNWLLLKANSGDFLPTDIPGRNTLLDFLYYWPLVLARCNNNLETQIVGETERLGREGGDSTLIGDLGREVAPKPGAYAWYLNLLQRIANELFGEDDQWRLLKTEMLLFAGATTFIAKEVAEELVPRLQPKAAQKKRPD